MKTDVWWYGYVLTRRGVFTSLSSCSVLCALPRCTRRDEAILLQRPSQAWRVSMRARIHRCTHCDAQRMQLSVLRCFKLPIIAGWIYAWKLATRINDVGGHQSLRAVLTSKRRRHENSYQESLWHQVLLHTWKKRDDLYNLSVQQYEIECTLAIPWHDTNKINSNCTELQTSTRWTVESLETSVHDIHILWVRIGARGGDASAQWVHKSHTAHAMNRSCQQFIIVRVNGR